MKVCVLLIFLCVVFNCDAKPEGAPISACSTLTPVHSQMKAQTDDPPYTVKAVKYGDKIKVTVSSPIGEEFQGFVLQARAATDRTRFIDGEFSESEEAKTQDCFNKNKNTLTHKRPTPKREVVTEWTPRGGVNEDVVFRATVAKTYAVFWTEVDSEPIKIGSDGSKPNARKTSNLDGNSMYDECFVSRGCFGFPSGCAQRRDCEVLLTYARAQDSVEFDMHGYLDSSEYMAMGISQDAVMGEDSVKECIRQGSEVVVRDSWNEGKSNTRTKALEKEEYISSFTNGLSSCSWSEPLAFEAHGQNFNLATNNYYVLLAKGGVSDGRLVYHAASKLATGVAVNFTAFESIAGAGITDSVKIHGLSSETTEFRNTPTVSFTTEEHEAKSTPASEPTPSEQGRNSSNCFNLNLGLLLLVLLELFYLSKGNCMFASWA